eukprot:408115_1
MTHVVACLMFGMKTIGSCCSAIKSSSSRASIANGFDTVRFVRGFIDGGLGPISHGFSDTNECIGPAIGPGSIGLCNGPGLNIFDEQKLFNGLILFNESKLINGSKLFKAPKLLCLSSSLAKISFVNVNDKW